MLETITESRTHIECVRILQDVWKSVDWDGMGGRRRMGIYDELAGKIVAAARCRTLAEFHTKLARAFGVRSTGGQSQIAIILANGNAEHLDAFRRETAFIIMLFRFDNEQNRSEKK